MKKILIVFSAILLALGAVGVASAASITVDPLDPTVISGDTITIDIIGLDFTVGTSGSTAGGTGGGGLDIAWDPDLLTLDSVTLTFPGSDTSLWDTGTLDAAAGTLTGLSVASFFSGTTLTDFSIAELVFTAGGIGVPGISATDIELSGVNIWADFEQAVNMNPAFVDGTVEVLTAPVPIPGSILLLGSGLVGLVGLVRRRRS